VQSSARDNYRTAIAIVAGIIHVLQVKRPEHSAPQIRAVETLEDFFLSIRHPSAAQKKPATSKLKVPSVVPGYLIHNECRAPMVQLSAPSLAAARCPERNAFIHFCISERLVASFIPSPSCE
jgi:hypothetical protein